jgi:hypothetical protein
MVRPNLGKFARGPWSEGHLVFDQCQELCQAIFCQLGNQFSLKIEAEFIGEKMQRWFVPATGDPITVQ